MGEKSLPHSTVHFKPTISLMRAEIHGLGLHVLECRKEIYTWHSSINDLCN